MQVANQMAEENPKQALEIAQQHLAGNVSAGVLKNIIGIMQNLQSRDPEAASKSLNG